MDEINATAVMTIIGAVLGSVGIWQLGALILKSVLPIKSFLLPEERQNLDQIPSVYADTSKLREVCKDQARDVKLILGELKDIHFKIDDNIKLLQDLHKWHDVTDKDGAKIWYVRSDLKDAIVKLTDTIEELGKNSATQFLAFNEATKSQIMILEAMTRQLKDQGNAMDKLGESITTFYRSNKT